jgi:hypothetical protein
MQRHVIRDVSRLAQHIVDGIFIIHVPAFVPGPDTVFHLGAPDYQVAKTGMFHIIFGRFFINISFLSCFARHKKVTPWHEGIPNPKWRVR